MGLSRLFNVINNKRVVAQDIGHTIGGGGETSKEFRTDALAGDTTFENK